MNAVVSVLLSMGANFLQSPQGQELLVKLLPNLLGGAKGLFDKIATDRDAGLSAEQQKVEMAKHIGELVAAAAAKADADHAAHPADDSGFDPGVFRD